jgi:CBS domain containing-hemolysin-like protein
MTARSSVVALPLDATEEDIVKQIEVEGYSRIPMYGESIDKIVGILHVRDYLLKRGQKDFSIENALLPPVFVPETVHLDNLFKDMQKNHTHIVIVVNEYGLTSGVVTMEDILEELVGESWDEQDEAVEDIAKSGENTYRVLSKTSIEEFFSFFELESRNDIESTTVNGWLTEHFGSIPQVNDHFDYEGLTVTVTAADDLMTHEVQVTVHSPREEQSPEDPIDQKTI